ncbi:MAG: fluoride efflux transporter CrcB [Hyphomicrobium sp.]|jgi:CrcB protein
MTAGALHVLIVAVAGVLGGIARFWVSGIVARRIGERFPWGTLAVNTTGALGIGILAALLPAFGVNGDGVLTLWLALVIGVLGSYTTVSSFSLQTLALIRESEWLRALLNIAGSLGLCLAATTAGYLSILWIFGN